MSHYSIVCSGCGRPLKEDYCAFCEHCTGSLLVTEYKDVEFSDSGPGEGIWRFNWLPVHSPTSNASGPVIYRSEEFSKQLGLQKLHIAFSGYWQERGAGVRTCTFKEFEAAVVLENARENGIDGLVVASAGNTARAFAHLSARTGYPVLIVVPLSCLSEMWYLNGSTPQVPTIVVSDGDYSDAIDMARRVALVSGVPFEGGVKNIAKRDGLGVVLLEAVSTTGRLPAHYFQAVGSGTGAIAVWEMSERFIRDGRFGSVLPQLHLAQNLPFAPMTHAWARGERDLRDKDLNPGLIDLISTRVLSNRYPAYSVGGGVFDALTASGGNMYGVTNDEAREAKDAFEKAEGIDIVPAAAVAVAALIKAVKDKAVRRDEPVLLNITGGGESGIPEGEKIRPVKGELMPTSATDEEIEKLLCNTLKKS